jgi:hypothetical protein
MSDRRKPSEYSKQTNTPPSHRFIQDIEWKIRRKKRKWKLQTNTYEKRIRASF